MIELIKPQLLILLPILYSIGFLVKKSNIKDELIPFLLTVISIILTIVYIFSLNEDTSILVKISSGIMQGVIIALVTVGANQYVKQTGKINKNKTDKQNDID